MSCLDVGKILLHNPYKEYIPHQQELEHVFEQKDLDVILIAELNLDERISMKVKKVNMMVRLIEETSLILTAYCSKNYSLPS